MITIEDVHNDLKTYVEKHPQLQEYGFGLLNNISTKNHKFPLLWNQITPSSFKKNHIVYRSNIYILDVLEHDLSNEVKVLSDSNLYAIDTIVYLYEDKNDLGYHINYKNIKINPNQFVFDDNLGGHDFEIEIPVPLTYCPENTPIS